MKNVMNEIIELLNCWRPFSSYCYRQFWMKFRFLIFWYFCILLSIVWSSQPFINSNLLKSLWNVQFFEFWNFFGYLSNIWSTILWHIISLDPLGLQRSVIAFWNREIKLYKNITCLKRNILIYNDRIGKYQATRKYSVYIYDVYNFVFVGNSKKKQINWSKLR